MDDKPIILEKLLDNEGSCRKRAKKIILSKRADKIDMEEWRCNSCLSTESIRIYLISEVKKKFVNIENLQNVKKTLRLMI